MRRFGFVILFVSAAFVQAKAQSSVLSSGNWYKFSVLQDGVYKIDYNLLKKAGVDPGSIDPKKIKIFTGQPGMLPQANSASRISDLQEIAIAVSGEEDGKFDAGDFIVFFGTGPDAYGLDPKTNFVKYSNNLFTDKNYYFLTIGTNAGKRAATTQSLQGSFPVINRFDDFAFYENEKYNLLHSGRQWFGEQFDQFLEVTIQFDEAGIIPNSDIKLTSHVMAQSVADCSFKISYNGTDILTQPIAPIINSTFATKGNMRIDTVVLNSSTVKAPSQNSQSIKYQFTKGSSGLSVGYLDYVLFSFQRSLALYGNQTIFSSLPSLSNAASTFQVAAAAGTTQIWEVSDPFNSTIQATNLNGNVLNFSTETNSLKKFIAFNSSVLTSPDFESKVTNQNLHGITSADFIMVTNAAWKDQAVRLANHRSGYNQLNSLVVTTDDIYNEYSGGKQDFSAIRDFIRDVYTKSNQQLKYVLLFGRGSYDYKNRVYSNTNYVPVYESVNSLNPLATYSSDDFFGFLDDNEGLWQENPSVDNTLNIGVGRIPVKSKDEAQAAVDKLIDYDTNKEAHKPWRKEFLFVADDGDFNTHQIQSNTMADNIESNYPEFDTRKIFLSNYKQIERAAGQFSPQARKALDLAVRKGAAIVNYTGHGSEQVWTQEQILTPDLIDSWKNAPMLPLFITATCEFGRNDDPFIISSGENLLLNGKGGAIGLVTSARPVYSSTNFQLNQSFYVALFTKSNNKFRHLGDIMKDTKNNSLSGVGNRNFSLLGDPSMELAFGNDEVIANEIKTAAGSDTLKALSSVTIKGEIQNDGASLNNFNGIVYASVYDKIQNLVAAGDPDETVNPPSPPFLFSERANKLFDGSASVKNGAFEFQFTMPDNLVPAIATGKLSLYASSDQGEDALGYSKDFSVGGQEADPIVDTTPPLIKLYMGDTTFVNGGIIGSNSKVVARLSDDSGINISSANPSNSIIATLDGKWSYILNDYYSTDKNNATRGTVVYPMDTLQPGAHKISLAVSDNYNNIGTASINFVVSDGSGIAIGDFYCYPNPFNSTSETTTFHFNHTRSGEDIEASLIIYDITGRQMAFIDFEVPSSPYQVDFGKWTGENGSGVKFSAGLYVAKLSVRSLVDGSKNERSTKLIILN